MDFDVVVVGGGAAGLMCAAQAGQGGLRVLVLERANRVGKKILMSGGGRCNFTNLYVTHENYLSANPQFCRSALARYTPWDFIGLVEGHGIAYHEKEAGQLFCDDSAKQIVAMLLAECRKGGVDIRTQVEIRGVTAGDGFELDTGMGAIRTRALVVASGGLSVPTLGGSGWGYEVARQFGHQLLPTRAGLVPFTLTGRQAELNDGLSGVSVTAAVRTETAGFSGGVLLTHRGISGPAVLQVSSYWQPGEPVWIDWLAAAGREDLLLEHKRRRPADTLVQALTPVLPVRLAERLAQLAQAPQPLQAFTDAQLHSLDHRLRHWQVTPSGTEGYRTAEVTLGGVDTREVSSRTFESLRQDGLYFVGEVLDVTGHLGGFNFQWAWASAVACARALQESR